MFSLFKRPEPCRHELVSSKLFDEKTFYQAFIRDLESCTEEVIIESPYITNARMWILRPVFERLVNRGVKVYVITRSPEEHEESLPVQAEGQIVEFEIIGVQVLLCKGTHHRKLAILDRKVLWEGSLNILSQTRSREIMRRIDNKALTEDMFEFLRFKRFI